jgi:crotonobetainyl-CoA:carnitine CoA-transferase CaiB-like acyl-CoA transferase
VSTAPLAGIRVLDTGMLYAAPLIATLLADHGAEVLKIEPPDGDQYRQWPAMWAIVGRNKRSITLDLTSEHGIELFHRVLDHVDVVVENLPRHLAERRRLTPEAMRATKPSLVVVSASGFGADGPYAERPANGTVAEAFSGLTGLTGDDGGSPQLPSAPLGDALAAAFGAVGALAGVVRALRTGEGATVDVTVYEPVLHALGTTLAGWSPGTPPPQRDGGAMGVALRGTFPTADGGWVAISASTPRQQRAAGELALDHPGDTLRARVAAWISATPTAVVAKALVASRIPANPVHDLAQMANDPQVVHRTSIERLGEATIVRPTPVIDGPRSAPSTATLGESNAEVYGDWLGLDPDQQAALHLAGVI